MNQLSFHGYCPFYERLQLLRCLPNTAPAGSRKGIYFLPGPVIPFAECIHNIRCATIPDRKPDLDRIIPGEIPDRSSDGNIFFPKFLPVAPGKLYLRYIKSTASHMNITGVRSNRYEHDETYQILREGQQMFLASIGDSYQSGTRFL